MATVTIPSGLTWQGLMSTIGDQLLAGFGSFENLGQLEEALFIALERDVTLEIIHTGPLRISSQELSSYFRVLADIADEEPLKVSFLDGAIGDLLIWRADWS